MGDGKGTDQLGRILEDKGDLWVGCSRNSTPRSRIREFTHRNPPAISGGVSDSLSSIPTHAGRTLICFLFLAVRWTSRSASNKKPLSGSCPQNMFLLNNHVCPRPNQTLTLLMLIDMGRCHQALRVILKCRRPLFYLLLSPSYLPLTPIPPIYSSSLLGTRAY